MDKIVHKQDWRDITYNQVCTAIQDEWPLVQRFPCVEMINELSRLRQGTLEVVEIRTTCTVYRIRQTGAVYQVHTMHRFFRYPSIDLYRSFEQEDAIIEQYNLKPLSYIAQADKDMLCVERVKKPRFRAIFYPDSTGDLHVSQISWHDPEPDNTEPYITKAAKFLESFFLNKAF